MIDSELGRTASAVHWKRGQSGIPCLSTVRDWTKEELKLLAIAHDDALARKL